VQTIAKINLEQVLKFIDPNPPPKEKNCYEKSFICASSSDATCLRQFLAKQGGRLAIALI
jgi:hypothetical protein